MQQNSITIAYISYNTGISENVKLSAKLHQVNE